MDHILEFGEIIGDIMVNELITTELKSNFKVNNLNQIIDGYQTTIERSQIDTSGCDSEKIIIWLTQRGNDQCVCKKLIIESNVFLDGDFHRSGLNAYIEGCQNVSFCSNKSLDIVDTNECFTTATSHWPEQYKVKCDMLDEVTFWLDYMENNYVSVYDFENEHGSSSALNLYPNWQTLRVPTNIKDKIIDAFLDENIVLDLG